MTDFYLDDRPEPAASIAPWWKASIWVLFFFCVSAGLQMLIRYPLDGDTAYHIAVGHLISKHGIVHSFLRSPYTWLAGRFADNEVLFHLLFVPLSGFEWLTAARVAGTFAGTALLSSMYLILRAEKVEFAALWALLPLTSVSFLARFALVRPHLLSVALTFLVLWACTHERLWVLLLCGILLPWTCDAFPPIAGVVLFSAESARVLVERKISWKSLTAIGIGFAAGIASHPNSQHLLARALPRASDMLFRHSGGWTATPDFLSGLLVSPYNQWGPLLTANVLMTVAAAALSFGGRPRTTTTMGAIFSASIFGILALVTPSFLEYFVPFSVAALACSARATGWRYVAHGLFAASVMLLTITGVEPLTTLVRQQIAPEDIRFLQRNIPKGETVFNCECDVTGEVTMALPERKLVVSLDPTLFCLKDSESYRLWYDLPRSAQENAAEIIRKHFRSRYVLAPNRGEFLRFFDQLYGDPKVRTVMLSEAWLFFDLDSVPAR